MRRKLFHRILGTNRFNHVFFVFDFRIVILINIVGVDSFRNDMASLLHQRDGWRARHIIFKSRTDWLCCRQAIAGDV
ncbi:hypothetical protein D3C80_1394100 [compost metagenome]